MTEAANPYASPVQVADGVETSQLEYTQTTIPNALMRWTLICCVSAAPSFFLGMAVTNGKPECVAAMLLGVGLFVLAYAIADTRPRWRSWMSQRTSRAAIIGVFGLRIFISIVFPIGIANDMAFGILTTGAFESVGAGGGQLGAGITFALTIMQGLLLNIEILAVCMAICGIMLVTRRFGGSKLNTATEPTAA